MGHLKNIIALFIVVLGNWSSFAQDDENPVKWVEEEVLKISDTEYDLIFRAAIADDWHVYSQWTPSGGALPTEFTFEKVGEAYELIGKTKESETETEFSDIFEVDETFFKKEAVFTQRIRLLDPKLRQIDASIFYQVCKEVCIQGDAEFSFSLDGGAVIKEEKVVDDRSLAMSSALKLDLKNTELLTNSVDEALESNSGLWTIFGLGFLGGLIALLTPCVFPMIPLTVSFFTKHSEKKSKGVANAILYGFFIINFGKKIY